jgi:uncharacterized protein
MLVIGNCIPGALALVWTTFEGHGQFRQLVASIWHWKTPPGWYLLAATLPCFVFVTSLDAVLFFAPIAHTFPPVVEFFKSLLLTLPFGPFWEEVAWRGLALRRLESHYSLLTSALMVGCYWAVWHIPLWLVTLDVANSKGVLLILMAGTNVVALSVIFAFIYERASHSLPVVIVLHATYVAAASQTSAVAPELNFAKVLTSMILFVIVAIGMGVKMRRWTGTHLGNSEELRG